MLILLLCYAIGVAQIFHSFLTETIYSKPNDGVLAVILSYNLQAQ